MRVLVISHGFPSTRNPVSGVAVARQVNALVQHGVAVSVVSPAPYCPRFLAGDRRTASSRIPRRRNDGGIEIHHPRYLRPPGKRGAAVSCHLFRVGSAATVRKIVRTARPDLIHAYAATPDGAAAAGLARRLGLPVVCTLLGSDINVYPTYSPWLRRITTRLLHTADRTIAVSEALRSEAARLAGVNIRCEVGYMGCDTSVYRFAPEARCEFRARIALSETDRVVLFLGNLRRSKGVFDLLEGFADVAREISQARLVYVGGGGERSELEQSAHRLGLADRVRFVGRPTHEEIPKWLSASDVFAFPSHAEGLPLAVLEAMACSRPVIATRVGGIAEAVQDGISGIVIPRGDRQGLTQGLERLLGDSGLAGKMGEAGRRTVQEAFTWERSASRVLQIYNDVLRGS